MRAFLNEALASLAMTAAMAVIVCGAYPLAVFSLAQGFFPGKANGSMVYYEGTLVGSALLGQTFESPQYFYPRPSAAGAGYDAMASGGSNLGPTSKALVQALEERAVRYRVENGLGVSAVVPADAVTASASGLDPHISIENAMLQATRIAKARDCDGDAVRKLIRANTEGRDWGLFGEPRVNVLLLNVALDKETKHGK